MTEDRSLKRRDAVKLAGIAAAALFGASAVRAAEPSDHLPKGPKIAPPPEDENAAEEEDLRASEMAGLVLRVVKPGQAVTMDYREDRLTITVDEKNVIKTVKIG